MRPACSAARSDGGWQIVLDGGERIDAERAGAGCRQPGARSAERVRRRRRPLHQQSVGRRKPRPRCAELAASGGDVLLVGTGLTMIDAGAVARCGGPPGPDRRAVAARADPRGARRFRAGAGGVERGSAGRRAGAVALAAAAQRRGRLARRGRSACGRTAMRLWQGLDGEQQRRFLRHARPWWDVHRHRIAPEVARQLHDWSADGRLEIVAGRIVADARKQRTGSRSNIGGAARARPSRGRFAYAFNCTGPLAVDRADPATRCCAACSTTGWCAPTSSASGSRSTTGRAPATSICGRWGR